MRAFIFVFATSALAGCVSQVSAPIPSYCHENSTFGTHGPESEHQYICHVPLEALVANPRVYDGYFIYSDGFLKLEYHGDLLYPSCTAAQAGRSTGRIGIRDQQYDMSGEEPLEGFVYHVVGTFDYSEMAVRNARLHLLPPWHEGFHGCEFNEDFDIGPPEEKNDTRL